MKRMINSALIGAACTALAVTLSPHAAAEPDPKLPNGAADFCPGGKREGYCLGEGFPDGTFYADRFGYGVNPFQPPTWSGFGQCVRIIYDSVQGAPPSGCYGLREAPKLNP